MRSAHGDRQTVIPLETSGQRINTEVLIPLTPDFKRSGTYSHKKILMFMCSRSLTVGTNDATVILSN